MFSDVCTWQVIWLDQDGRQLSFGNVSYYPDRYDVHRPYLRDWNLEIRSVRTDDAGTYECRYGLDPVRKYVQLIVEGSFVVNTRRR